MAEGQESDVSRRLFLRVMGASMGLAGLSACTRAPRNKIVPYVVQPPEVTPGKPAFYATTMAIDGYGVGLVVESHEGRPTKVEGNPDHPDSVGATGPFEQAHVLSLYEPSRARAPLREGEPASWAAFVDEHANAGIERGGAGLHFLLEPTSSPSLLDLVARVKARLPGAGFHFGSPAARSAAWEGARIAFGRPLETRFDLRGARVIVVLGGDLLAAGPGFIPRARAFADGRRMMSSGDEMNRLYVAETALSSTGSLADHRLALREVELPAFVAALAGETLAITGVDPAAPPELSRALAGWKAPSGARGNWVRAVARDLANHRGACAVMAADRLPPEAHAAVHWMNVALGNIGHTMTLGEPPIFEAGGPSHDFAPLARELEAGNVETLVILGGNPAYARFADVDVRGLFGRAKRVVYVGPYENETARIATWFLPATHDFEAWGDARATDGTVSIAQPLIERLYDSHTPSEVLAVFAGDLVPDAAALLRAYWVRNGGEERFRASIAKGVVDGSAFPEVNAALDWASLAKRLAPWNVAEAAPGLEIRFALDARVHDGRFANNAWLLELPDPITALTWDNAALVSPNTAAKLGVTTEQLVELTYRGRTLRAPILVMPGHADDSITLPLGYGRSGKEAVAAGAGFDAYALRTSQAPHVDVGVSVRKLKETYELARAQTVQALHGRDDHILLHRTLGEYRADPSFAREARTPPPTLYLLKPSAPRQWGMVIDLNACVGCNACVVACQSENNVPVVGKNSVRKGRRMHWLRVDRYYAESPGGRVALPQPMLCQHCETAPCEYVCPVNATNHSSDGLNQMVYNRCVGTRFCSNNCPYKVRRFNWFDYNRDHQPVEDLVHNPDVTVRERGVMEKCTYCVQRIREHEVSAAVQGRPLVDGEIKTACQQVCPAHAITFGDLASSRTEVSRWAGSERAFAALNDLNTRPRTRYLAKIWNPNPELA